MKKHRIILSTALLVLALGTSGSQFAQNALSQSERTNQSPDRELLTIGFLRTINTAEAANFSEHATYESWPDLVAQSDYLNGWLATYYPNAHFGKFPEVLPGMKLRLSVHTDGHGYDVLLEDATDKTTGYAAISDERGVIRECKWLQ